MQTVGNIFVISAASGTGKSSLIKALLDRDSRLKVSISHTTRSPRGKEQNGVEYHFVSQARFCDLITKQYFLEWANVHDNYYGTAKTSVLQLTQAGWDVILEIDVQGAKQVKQIFPQANLIFILPPSLNELAKRLNSRGEDSLATITKRLQNSVAELKHTTDFKYVIINDNFDQAVEDLLTIIRATRLALNYQQLANQKLFKTLNIIS